MQPVSSRATGSTSAHRATASELLRNNCASENLVALKPATISHVEAASLPLVGLTTLQGFGRAGARAGQRILIHAGSGGVGTFAVQYAKHLGLHVTSTTSSRNADFVKSLGADRIIAYDRENYLEQGGDYDIVYDTLGGAFTIDAFKLVKRGGAVISLSGPPDRYFARREGAGLLVRVAVRLMGQRLSASAKAGAAYCLVFHRGERRSVARHRHSRRLRRDQAGDRSRIRVRTIAGGVDLSRTGAREGQGHLEGALR